MSTAEGTWATVRPTGKAGTTTAGTLATAEWTAKLGQEPGLQWQ